MATSTVEFLLWNFSVFSERSNFVADIRWLSFGTQVAWLHQKLFILNSLAWWLWGDNLGNLSLLCMLSLWNYGLGRSPHSVQVRGSLQCCPWPLVAASCAADTFCLLQPEQVSEPAAAPHWLLECWAAERSCLDTWKWSSHPAGQLWILPQHRHWRFWSEMSKIHQRNGLTSCNTGTVCALPLRGIWRKSRCVLR